MTSEKPLWLVAAPLIFLGLWSGGYAVAKFALQFSEPMTLLALRYGLVVVIMVVLFAVLRPPLPTVRADWVHLAVVGFLLQSVYFGMCYLAFYAGVAAGSVALLMSLQPILVGLMAPRWTGEQIGWKRWAGLALGLIGTAVVIAARSEIESPSTVGFICAALALLGITAGSLWEKRFGLSHHPVVANLVGYIAGLAGILPFMFWLETSQINWNWEFTAALAYLVIGNSVIAVGLLLAMIRAGDVSRVSALFFLVPPLVRDFADQLELGVYRSAGLSGDWQFGYCGRLIVGHDQGRGCQQGIGAVLSGATAGGFDGVVVAGRTNAPSCMGRHGAGRVGRISRDAKKVVLPFLSRHYPKSSSVPDFMNCSSCRKRILISQWLRLYF